MTHAPSLQSLSFFAGLPLSDIAKLSRMATTVSFAEGDMPLAWGSPSHRFYVLVSGSAGIEIRNRYCAVRVQSLEAGDAFGWSSLLENQDTLFQVRAREACTALCFDGESLAELLHQDQALGVRFLERILRLVAGRVTATESAFAQAFGMPHRKINGAGRQAAAAIR
jgi:CRP-like cAMP-binding protein